MVNIAYDAYDPFGRGGLEQWLRHAAGDNAARRERLLRNLHQAMERELTPRQREMVQLRYGEGCSVTDIALRLAVNKSTVSRCLTRATGKLRRFLVYSL